MSNKTSDTLPQYLEAYDFFILNDLADEKSLSRAEFILNFYNSSKTLGCEMLNYSKNSKVYCKVKRK